MSEITQPGAQGITAQTIIGSTKLIIGARRNTALSAPAGTTISLTMYLRKSAKLCSSPQGPTTFGPLPQLHRRPDLAVGVHQEREADEDDDRHRQALRQDQDEEAEAAREELHRRYSAASAWPCRDRASRDSSAITSLARMIGLAR